MSFVLPTLGVAVFVVRPAARCTASLLPTAGWWGWRRSGARSRWSPPTCCCSPTSSPRTTPSAWCVHCDRNPTINPTPDVPCKYSSASKCSCVSHVPGMRMLNAMRSVLSGCTLVWMTIVNWVPTVRQNHAMLMPSFVSADGEHVAHLPAAVQPGRLPPRLHPLPGPGVAPLQPACLILRRCTLVSALLPVQAGVESTSPRVTHLYSCSCTHESPLLLHAGGSRCGALLIPYPHKPCPKMSDHAAHPD